MFSALPPRILLLGGTEMRFHRPSEVVPPLAELITVWGGEVRFGLGALALTSQNLACCDAILSVTTGGSLTFEQESALLDAVANTDGKRKRPLHFIGLHGASCSFEGSDRYLALLGGRFVSHPPVREFRLDVDDPTHPLTRGIDSGPFTDEQYVIEPRTPFTQLISSVHGGLRTPCLWAKQHGQGKVVYCALGHGAEQARHPTLRRIVQNALDWCLGPRA